MANFQIPAPPSGKRPVDTYQWLGKILEALNNTKGVDWHTNNILTIKELGDSIGNDRNFVSTVDNKITTAFQPVAIKASTDLNTLTTTGLYTSDSDGNAQTITNKPTGITTGFILQVYPICGSGTSKRLVQLLYSRQNGVLYMRSKAEDDVWSPWINVITSADVTSSNTANKVVQRDASGNFSAGTITASLNGNAKTATTLQTARTINGTSFNGSANITTANWGTARTLTIGSTGKSVNGSANVSWSLSEIGAAAASHTHTSSQITDATNANTANMIVKRDASGNFSAGTITASLSGNATTATTLQTARTINGTSFNGSANITTANWGTARTLTIGNTGKSVNGSANVSWSLSEIGAASSSHTHNSLMATSLDGQTISLDTINLSSGTPKFAVYSCSTDGNGSGITGRPNDSAKNAFSLLVESVRFASTTDYITKQTYTQGNTKVMHVRYCTNGTWSTWEKVYTSVQKPTASEIGAASSSHTHNYAGSSSAGGNANAAVKLATARSINGTSFDGTANITTANWGTARTLTIGSTGKSVNGSGNVSWSLSEIGAAAASHTHTSSQITDATNANTANMIVKRDASGNFSAGTITASLSGNATTATKLQTARSINGTSFDGSANITTANWGTARTLTIGSTGKSVNGSGNVSWSLSEIGASPVENGVQRWNSVIKCATWSRILYLSGHTTIGYSGIMNIQGTRANVVFNVTLLITASHAGKVSIAQLNNTTYSNLQIRGIVNDNGDVYIEVYDNANGATNTTSQTLNISYINLSAAGIGTITKYTSFTDGTTIPSGFKEAHKITTVSGNNYVGNASTATTLQTARTINGTSFNGSANITTANWGTARTLTIGNSGKSVNGSGNVSWSLSEIGAAAASHTHTSSQITDATNANTANMIVKRDASGNFSAGTITASLSGNATTATTLQTARTINGTSFNGSANITTANWGTARTLTIGNTGKSVNGSADVSWSLSEIGAAAASHTHNYLPLTGGTVTGETIFNHYLSLNAWPNYGTGKVQLWYDGNKKELAPNNSSLNDIRVNGGYVYHQGRKPTPADIGAAAASHTHNYAGSSSAGGNANAAVKLATARSINGTSFDGTANITTANWGTARTLTIGNTGKSVNGSANVSWSLSEIGAAAASHTHSYLPLSGGTITGSINYNSGSWNGTAIHLGAGNDSNGAYIGIGAGGLTIIGGGESTSAVRGGITNGSDERMIVANDQGIEFMTGLQSGFDSRKTVSISAAGVLSAPYGITGSLSGNASTATTLQTARTINGTSFNGSANITTANWGTARNITIGNTKKSVNGSADVSWSLSEIGAAAASHTHSNYVSTTDYTLTTITKTLTITTSWQDTGITGTNLKSGSYMIQVSGMSSDATSMYSEIFTGVMSWTDATTNSTDYDEIILHKAGHASNGRAIYLRTIRSSSSGYLKLQIAASTNFTSTSVTFKFRKLI